MQGISRLGLIISFCIAVCTFKSVQSQNSATYGETIAICQEVEDPDRQVGNYNGDSIPNLPIGLVKEINGTKYIIAIDSAYFLPDGAYFSAYMAVDFPGADRKIAFAAKDIKFNPKGVLGGEQAKLQLVSEHYLNFGPNIKLRIPDDGSNYVKWGCNGFESANLAGSFIFSEGILEPLPESPDTAVTASFEVNVTDLSNILTSVSFTSFQIRGVDGYSFVIDEAFVDMSDNVNPPGVILPLNYQTEYAGELQLWRGFYLKNFTITLPEEISKSEGATSIYARDMFVDNSGVSGLFGATNLFTTTEGEMAGKWGFSVEELEIGLTSNKITSGLMAGRVAVPALDDNTIQYGAFIQQNLEFEMVDYSFSLSPEKPLSMDAFNSTLTFAPASTIYIERWGGKFQPRAVLHGDLTLNNDNLKLNQLAFEQLTIVTESPFITDGIFALTSSDGSGAASVGAGGFKLSISEIMFGIVDLKPVFGCHVALNLGKESSANNFSIASSIRVYCKIEKDARDKYKWEYDRFKLNDIAIGMHTNAFQLDGLIRYSTNDPVYGKGFYGKLEFGIAALPAPIVMQCAFGKLPAYKYWMVDVEGPLPPINITNQIQMNYFMGGIAYHMVNKNTNKDLISASARFSESDEMSYDYIPDEDAGLFLKAGIGIKHTASENVLNGDVIFSIGFNASGGLSFIQFEGITYSMCTRKNRATAENYVKSITMVNYDHNNKIFNAQMVSEAQFADAIYANIWAQIYLSPGHWHFHIGTPPNPGIVRIKDFAEATSYFMMGQDLPPMPPPPPQVTSVFNTMNSQRDEGAAAGGSGIATGFNLTVGFEEEIGFKAFKIYGSGYAGTGFDMTLYKYAPGTHCLDGEPEFGMNNWYMQGQLYAYLTLNCGIAGKLAGKEFDLNLLAGNAALLLQGKLPKPTYVYGGIHLSAKVLSVIDVSMNFDFDAGTNCEIVSG